jgi:hypothetical protein
VRFRLRDRYLAVLHFKKFFVFASGGSRVHGRVSPRKRTLALNIDLNARLRVCFDRLFIGNIYY